MEFDSFTVVLLESHPNRPELSPLQAEAIQDAHMDHLAKLHEAGLLRAAGPIVDPPESRLRGVCIFAVPQDQARALLEQDPAIRARQLTARVLLWSVPKGAVGFSSTKFPHSMVDLG